MGKDVRSLAICGLILVLSASTAEARSLAATGCVALYGQCGGISQGTPWTKCCASGTCQLGNPYYSQCLPSSAPAPQPQPNPTPNPTPAPAPSGGARRCGRSWDEANRQCVGSCPGNDNRQCPSGLNCWSNLDLAPCNGPTPNPAPTPTPNPTPNPPPNPGPAPGPVNAQCAIRPVSENTDLIADPYFPVSGFLTYYGGAGKRGNCQSEFNYEGFSTVAMNHAQYNDGAACGACVYACFTDNVGKHCFKAIVDNQFPEGPYAALDWGVPIPPGGGRWPVKWSYIACPNAQLRFRTEGSNPNYGKLKIEGGGQIVSVTCDGKAWQGTNDGFWVGGPIPGKLLTDGITCRIKKAAIQGGGTVTANIPGSLFVKRSS